MADFFGRSTDDTINGTDDADTIYGRSGNDLLNGNGGDDSIFGGSGADTLNGGAGNDQLAGGSGDDVLNGGSGADVLQGDGGDDILSGGSGADMLMGGSGDDVLGGDGGADTLMGGSGDDDLFGGNGDDVLSGGTGDDLLDGGAGDDILDGGAGDNVIATGSGSDIVRISDPAGTNLITDFDPTTDKLDLTALTGVTRDNLTIVQSGDSVVITSDAIEGSITIQGVTVDEVTAPGVIAAVACFVAGTTIRTPSGEVPVEALAIGDLVVTADGRARPVRWIGRRAFSRRFAASNPRVVPVRVRANAIAAGVPSRDLCLSPEHALYVDGVLVPAGLLVNGRSIVRDESFAIVAYHHVELDGHDVLFANGTLAETYADHGNRRMFANWEEYGALYGDAPAAETDYARIFDTVQDGPELDRVRARLDERAGIRRAA